MGATGYSRPHSRHRNAVPVAMVSSVGLDALGAPRAEDRSWLLIGQALAPGVVPAVVSRRFGCWLPRRHRACPSAALDERVPARQGITWGAVGSSECPRRP